MLSKELLLKTWKNTIAYAEQMYKHCVCKGIGDLKGRGDQNLRPKWTPAPYMPPIP